MDGIGVEVDVSSGATRDVVEFRIDSYRSEPTAVLLCQPLAGGVSRSQVAVPAGYETTGWAVTRDALEFRRELDWGASVETAYGVEGSDAATVRTLLAAASVEARDADGEVIQRIDDLDERIDPADGDDRNPPRIDPVADVEGAGDPGDGVEDRETRIDAAAADGPSSATAASANGDTDAGEGPPDAGPSSGRGGDRAVEGVAAADTDVDPGAGAERGDDGVADADSAGADLDSAGADLDGVDADADGAEADSAAGSDDGRLPATVSEYVLQDTPERMEAGEFAWTALSGPTRPDAEPGAPGVGDGTSREKGGAGSETERGSERADEGGNGLLARIRSWF